MPAAAPRRPVTDWATDFDHLSPQWAAREPEILADLRARCPVGGCPVGAGQRMLLSFGSANRDPEQFERPDELLIDRIDNRHLAFGVGVHRCLGSNLARLELRVALQRWLARYPRFAPAGEVTWTIGVRGPRTVPVRLG